MDSTFRNTMILGVFAYGALGLGGLIAAGLVWGDRSAVLFGIAACGASYAAQHAGAVGYTKLNLYATLLALAFALVAFASLLVGF